VLGAAVVNLGERVIGEADGGTETWDFGWGRLGVAREREGVHRRRVERSGGSGA
jgi:hypothetical protein